MHNAESHQRRLLPPRFPPSTTHVLLSVQLSTEYKIRMSNLCAQHDTVAELIRYACQCNPYNMQLTLVTRRELFRDLVQQKAHTSPSSPTTSSSTLSSRVGATHKCAGTCSHGPYVLVFECLVLVFCKRKSTCMYSCNSVPDPLHMLFTMLRLPLSLSMATQPLPPQGPSVGRMATSPMPSWGSPQGDKFTSGYITPAFSGFPWWGEIKMATSPLPSRVPNGGEKSKWLHHPYLLKVPMVGRINLERSGCGGDEQKKKV